MHNNKERAFLNESWNLSPIGEKERGEGERERERERPKEKKNVYPLSSTNSIEEKSLHAQH